MTVVRDALADYLRVRRQLGAQLKTSEPMLEQFVDFLEQRGAVRITSELAVTWAKLPAGARPDRWAVRLGMVRGSRNISRRSTRPARSRRSIC